ncbi:MAG TPA: ribonuclease P protein component [Patescibacteria group bacterium]|nr:ribonuclease P protein component [Patescibacteria group bacterium]
MLPKANRLRRNRDFRKIYQKSRKFRADFFIIRYLPNNLPDSRIGIVISAKAVKKAVRRNLLKRKISEIIRLNLNKIKPGLDIIISVFQMPEDLSSSTLTQTVIKNLALAKIIND